MALHILLALAVIFVYYLLKKKYGRFRDTGVPSKTAVPLLGSMWKSITKRCHIIYDVENLYRNYGDEKTRYIGFYNTIFPGILVKDPQLIKQVTIKDADIFNEHLMTIGEAVEPILGRNLVSLKGKKWRDMRTTLSPAFTSSKMRDMYAFVTECGKQMSEYTMKQCRENNKKYGSPKVEVELKDFSSRYMNDVIASSAYGIKVDSFNDRDNDFFTRGKYLTTFSFYQFLKLTFGNVAPKLARILDVRLFDKDQEVFFKHIVSSTMKYREENNVIRRDMIHLLMQAKKGSLKHDDEMSEHQSVEESDVGKCDVKTVWTEDDIVAQAMIFFFAGFDTSSTLMNFVLYELAMNKTIQKKLQDEIDEVVAKYDDNISYEHLHAMKYLDMVITEGLRKWPPLPVADRVALKDVNVGPIREGGSETFTLNKGESVWIPIYCIQHDSRFWKDPEVFNPDRFSDENKDSVQPFTFLPFGIGPRNCIGSRFALMQSKAMLFHLMADFSLELSSKTRTPLEFDTNSIPFMKPKGGTWAKFSPRRIKL